MKNALTCLRGGFSWKAGRHGPGGTAGNSPAFQRRDLPRPPSSPEGTAESGKIKPHDR
jgi:hypothetical protein